MKNRKQQIVSNKVSANVLRYLMARGFSINNKDIDNIRMIVGKMIQTTPWPKEFNMGKPQTKKRSGDM